MSALGRDYIAAGDFFGSIMAGFLLGFGGDWLFATRPTLTVLGIIGGSITGFYVMFRQLKAMDDV